MESSQPDTRGPSNQGSDLGPHFTDWREQLRDRVREIRARKLADKRAEENGESPDPDLAEQAAAARAEKLRAAREAVDKHIVPVDTEPELIADTARIEQRVERISEEVHEVAEAVAGEAASDWEEAPFDATGIELDIEEPDDEAPEADLAFEAPAAGIDEAFDENMADDAPAVAALEDSAAAITLGSGDRSARRSDIADVVDALLDRPGMIEASVDEPQEDEAPEIDLGALFGTDREVEAAEPPGEAIELTDEESEEPAGEAVDFDAGTDEALPDPFANAPAWARASFAPRRERREEHEFESTDGIPPELEDVDIPSWALPRQEERRPKSERAADLFADQQHEQEVDEPVAAPEVDELAAGPATSEAPSLADQPAPEDAELFAPEEEETEPFADSAPSTPLSDLLGRAEREIEREKAEEAIETLEQEFAAELDEGPEVEEESAAAAAIEAEAIEADADFETDEPEEIYEVEAVERVKQPDREPDSAIAAAIDAAIQRPPHIERKEGPDGDVFLVGEFRTRGRIVQPAFEEAPRGRPEPAAPEPPAAATARPRRQPEPEMASRTESRSEPIVEPFAARAGLFDEPDPEHEQIAAAEEIEWDLGTPGDPDTILDAQRGDADPSAPVADRIFSAVADAMVLLTIAMLLAIAGSRAAGAPIVPFVQAAPLPFFLAVMLFGFAYAVFFNGTCGQTLGKMAMRVRVIGGDTFRVGYQRAAQRALYYTVATLPAGLGLLPALRDPEHRALHDRLSNTRVVKA